MCKEVPAITKTGTFCTVSDKALLGLRARAPCGGSQHPHNHLKWAATSAELPRSLAMHGREYRLKSPTAEDLQVYKAKKQGAAGITTAAPYVAGQWGRGEDR